MSVDTLVAAPPAGVPTQPGPFPRGPRTTWGGVYWTLVGARPRLGDSRIRPQKRWSEVAGRMVEAVGPTGRFLGVE